MAEPLLHVWHTNRENRWLFPVRRKLDGPENTVHVLLIVQNNSFPTDKRVAKEALSLKKAGYEVSAISPVFGRDQLRRETWNGISVYRYRHFESSGGVPGFILEYGNALLRIFLQALGLFLRKPFKSIHVANPPDFFWPMALFFRLFRVKLIFDQHDISAEMYLVNERKGKNVIYRFLNWSEKMTVRCADGIITTNTSIKERLNALYGLRGKPHEVVYNGPAVDFIAKKDPALRQEYDGKRVLLYIGEMARIDCVEVILFAAEQVVLSHGRGDCVFVLLGDGPDRSRLEALASEKGLDDCVEFAGMVDHDIVMKYLDVAEICLVPDEPNGLNELLTLIKCLEYMKAARPFVAFDLAETRLIAGDCALFAGNIGEYIEHVLRLLDHPEEATVMGARGQTRVEEGFLWSHQVPKLLRLYDAVLSE
jgi:glycosyltransferase involved in cell wall biosynthesis